MCRGGQTGRGPLVTNQQPGLASRPSRSKWYSARFHMKMTSSGPCSSNINPLCSLWGGRLMVRIGTTHLLLQYGLIIYWWRGKVWIIEYPHCGRGPLVSFLHFRLSSGWGKVELVTHFSACIRVHIRVCLCVCNSLLSVWAIPPPFSSSFRSRP